MTDYDDFILWLTLGIILGGCSISCLFHRASGRDAALEGRHVVHGGVMGCVIAVVAFARHRGIPILSLGDVTRAVALIGFPRPANFINGELWGCATDVPWAMSS